MSPAERYGSVADPGPLPVLKSAFHLDFGQIGLITLTSQITASLLQPVIGLYTDRLPQPFSLAFGMGFTLFGLLLLSVAPTYGVLLIACAVVEWVRGSQFLSNLGEWRGLPPEINTDWRNLCFKSVETLGLRWALCSAAFIVVPRGQASVAYFSAAALLGIALLSKIGGWGIRASWSLKLYRSGAIVGTWTSQNGRSVCLSRF